MNVAARVVIWDFNGTLADDEHLHGAAFAAALAERGHDLTLDAYVSRYLGLDDHEMLGTAMFDFTGARPDPVRLRRRNARGRVKGHPCRPRGARLRAHGGAATRGHPGSYFRRGGAAGAKRCQPGTGCRSGDSRPYDRC